MQLTLARLRGLHTSPSRVLSIDSNSANFDSELAAVLSSAGARLDLVGPAASFTKTVAGSGSALESLHHIGDLQSFFSGEAFTSEAPATYDIVILPLWRLAVQWAGAPERLQALFASAYKVLAPGGTLLLAEADAVQGVFACREAIHSYVPPDTLAALRASAALAVGDGSSASEAKRSSSTSGSAAAPDCIFHDDGVAVTLDLSAVHAFLRRQTAAPAPGAVAAGSGSAGSSRSELQSEPAPDAAASPDAVMPVVGAGKDGAAPAGTSSSASSSHSGSSEEDATLARPAAGRDREPLLFVEPLDAVLDLTAPTAVYRSIITAGGGAAGGLSRSSSGGSSSTGATGGGGGGALGTPAQQAAACAILSDVFGVDARGLAAFSRPLAADVLASVEGLNLYNVREGATSGSGAEGGLASAPRRVTVHVPLRLWHVRKPAGHYAHSAGRGDGRSGGAGSAASQGAIAAAGRGAKAADAGSAGDSTDVDGSATASSATAGSAAPAASSSATVSVLESVTSVALSAVSAVTRGTLSSLSLSFLSASSSSITSPGAGAGASVDNSAGGGRGKWWLLGCDSAPAAGAPGSAPGSAPGGGRGPWSAIAAVGGAAEDSDGGAAARSAYVHYLRRLPVASVSAAVATAPVSPAAQQGKSKRQKQHHGPGGSGAGASVGSGAASAFAPGGGLLCPNARRFPLALPPLPLLLSTPGALAISADGQLAFPGPGVPQRAQASADAQAQQHKSKQGGGKHQGGSGSGSGNSASVDAGSSATADAAAAAAAPSVTFDPCFPCGRARGFLNIGLANWQAQRAAWTARPAGYAHPPYPPDLGEELDDLLDELTDTEVRQVDLPGPVRLPDMLDLLLECWSPVDDDSDSDPEW